MLKKVCTLILGLCFCIFAVNAQELEKWKTAHPDALQGIAFWVQTNPASAHAICDWDAAHPDHSQAFVDWAITKPGQDPQQFCQMHNDWTELHDVLAKDKNNTAVFIKICYGFKDAMKELMTHPGGLKWVSDNFKISSNK